ncbi:MAG: hypothetical protein ACI9W6_000032 [Motiliproteus sp.]|jgi:hypothetical protein
MKTKKLLERIRAFFDVDLRDNLQMQASLTKVLEKLRLKQKKIQAELELEQDADRREALQLKIDLVHSQRKKGIAMLRRAQTDAGERKPAADAHRSNDLDRS